MADNSPSLIPFLGAMTASQREGVRTSNNHSSNRNTWINANIMKQGYSTGNGSMGSHPNVGDMESPYPSQSYHTQTPTRSIHVDFTGWPQRVLGITEGSPSGAVIYRLDLTQNRQMKFYTTSASNTPLATATSRGSTSLDVAINGQRIAVDIKTRLRKEGQYRSPSLHNAPLAWKSRSMKVVDFELRDGNGTLLAQFNPHPSWSRRKAGRLDLFGPSVSSGRLMEEIMVTGLSLVHSTDTQLEAAAAGASS